MNPEGKREEKKSQIKRDTLKLRIENSVGVQYL